MNFTAIDFETANKKRSSACAIGMAKVRDGKVVDTYYSLIKPEPCEFDFINSSIHGIRKEQVLDQKTLLELWADIAAFVGDDVLVAHNVSFEQSVINQYLAMHRLGVPTFDYLCTMYMSKVNYPRLGKYALPDLCRELLGKEVNHHDALEDALACAELAIHHIGKFREQDPRNLIEVLYATPQREKKQWVSLSGIKSNKDDFDPTHPLHGKLVAVTGTLTSMTREDFVRYLVDVGASYSDNLVKNTDILLIGGAGYSNYTNVQGEKSSKWLKAEQMIAKGGAIKIVEEADFFANYIVEVSIEAVATIVQIANS